VAQRFTAAIKGLFSVPALAAEGDYRAPNDSFRNLFSRAVTAKVPDQCNRKLFRDE
jgi:hypothetical protein